MHPGEIHLLLTDVVMPGMSGPRLAEVLTAEREGLRCLFMSGYAATALEQKILVQGETTLLQKPFTTAQLLRRVREVIDAPAPAGRMVP
jgi:FixJ family two-component response regulator